MAASINSLSCFICRKTFSTLYNSRLHKLKFHSKNSRQISNRGRPTVLKYVGDDWINVISNIKHGKGKDDEVTLKIANGRKISIPLRRRKSARKEKPSNKRRFFPSLFPCLQGNNRMKSAKLGLQKKCNGGRGRGTKQHNPQHQEDHDVSEEAGCLTRSSRQTNKVIEELVSEIIFRILTKNRSRRWTTLHSVFNRWCSAIFSLIRSWILLLRVWFTSLLRIKLLTSSIFLDKSKRWTHTTWHAAKSLSRSLGSTPSPLASCQKGRGLRTLVDNDEMHEMRWLSVNWVMKST